MYFSHKMLVLSANIKVSYTNVVSNVIGANIIKAKICICVFVTPPRHYLLLNQFRCELK